MATKIHRRTNPKKVIRFKHKRKIRSKLTGTDDRPRLSVFRSNQHLYVQLVDDRQGHTLASASTLDEELKTPKRSNNLEVAKGVGSLIAKRALAKNIKQVVFDRNGYVYHGRVKALADAARESGLKF